MPASKEETTSATSTSYLEMMLSRPYSSKEEFVREYNEHYGEELEAKKFYISVLIELEKAISGDNIESFKKLSTVIDYTSDLVSKETLLDNPIRNTNLVILASKHNGINILRYLLDSDSELLNNLSVAIGKASISPKDEDEVHHNAFYYAIRSENIQLLDTLITNKFFKNYFAEHSEELEEILSKNYEELKLKNVPLSDEMQYFVEHKLIDHRFFSTEQHPTSNPDHLTKERIKLLLQGINWLNKNYQNTGNIDGKFLNVAKFIARNIHILKRWLKSTYDKIPWEEMEFCLVIFVSSQTSIKGLNLFYCLILNKEKILKYLENFANELKQIKNITSDNKIPKNPRKEIVKNIIITNFQFKELYDDYHQIRDIYSLKAIFDHIKLAVSADVNAKEGQLMIIRVLQVIGEHIKNTPESPKLSDTTSELLELSLSHNARNQIKDLREVMSHASRLSKLMEIEQNADDEFFINIKSDIRKLGDVITNIFNKNKIKTIRIFLKKVVESEKEDEIKEVLAKLDTAEVDRAISENIKTMKQEELEKVIMELSYKIPDKSYKEKNLLDKINSIIKGSKNQTENIGCDHLIGYTDLQSFNVELNCNNHTDENFLKMIKDYANRVLKIITVEIKPNEFEEIVRLSMEILDSVKLRTPNEKFDEVNKLIMKIISISKFETNDIKNIEQLTEKLPKGKKNLNPDLSPELKNTNLSQKLTELETTMSKLPSNEFKVEKEFLTLIKMLVLDIMVILGSSREHLENNHLFLDGYTPLLHGKCLRNYLAHHNALVDVLLSDPLIAVILNARKLTDENIMERKIGKLVSDNPVKLKEKFYQDLKIITDQEKMFIDLENEDLNRLKDNLKNGADIKARSSVNSWTTLHFAAKGPSLEVIRFILDQNLSVDVKNNHGETPLHIAAAHGKQDIVKFFLTKPDICVDVQNNKGETPLHVAARNGHEGIVENLLLKNKDGIFTLDTRGFSPVYYAIRNNRINVAKILLKDVDINETVT